MEGLAENMDSVKIIKNFENKVPSWESLLYNLNHSFIYKNEIKHNHLGFIVSHDANLIFEVADVLKRLNLNAAHLYINLVIESNTFGRHCDEDDVYFWQVQGSTKWIFDNDNFTLKKGDLIQIPKGTYHEVKPLSPRAGISMSL